MRVVPELVGESKLGDVRADTLNLTLLWINFNGHLLPEIDLGVDQQVLVFLVDEAARTRNFIAFAVKTHGAAHIVGLSMNGLKSKDKCQANEQSLHIMPHR
ncbi:hypothetical protein D3C71_1642740 [compost metagenome]